MREERVGLENGVDRPPEGRKRCDVFAMEQDFARCREIEAGDQPQKRGLAAAGWAQQREELVFPDFEEDPSRAVTLSGPVP
jgi:hypothetical protein